LWRIENQTDMLRARTVGNISQLTYGVLRLQNLEPKEEGRHDVAEIDYVAISGALQTGKERAVGTPKLRWGCCVHKIL
jgi:hypothetical protein